MTEAIHIPREVYEHLDPLYKAAATVLAESGGCIIDGEEVHADE
jgi:hypothetical protein